MGLRDPITGQNHHVPGGEPILVLVIGHARHKPEGHARGPELDHTRLVTDIGQVVPGVGHDDPARLGQELLALVP